MSLFGGLNLKVKKQLDGGPSQEEGRRTSISSTVSTGSASNGGGTGISSGFGFLSGGASEAPPAAPSPSSGFGFLQGPTETSTNHSAENTNEAASSSSSFSFLGSNESPNPPQDNSASAIAAALSAAADTTVDLLTPATVIKPANIKKKRGTRLPGFARSNSGMNGSASVSSDVDSRNAAMDEVSEALDHVEEEEAARKVQKEAAAAAAQEDGESILTGLTIHHDTSSAANDDDEEEDDVTQPTQLHAADEGTAEAEDHLPTPDEAEHQLHDIEVAHHHHEKEVEDEPVMQPPVAAAHAPVSSSGGFSFMKQQQQQQQSQPVKTKEDEEEEGETTIAAKPKEPEKENEDTITDAGELGDLLRAFQRGARKFATDLRKVNKLIQEAEENMEKVDKESSQLEQKLKGFEDEQNAALEAEDFDKADQIQKQIDGMARSMGEVESKKIVLGREIGILEKQKRQVFKEEVENMDLIAELLEDCCKKETVRAKTFCKETKEEIEKETARLDEEDDTLRIELEGIASDLEVVQKELDQINAKVDAGTVELREQKDEWQTKIDAVDEEIAELERQLREKQAIRAEFDLNLQEVNAGIQAVRSKYESRLNELDTRQQAVDEKQEAARLRSQSIETTRKELQERGVAVEQAVTKSESDSAEIALQLGVLNKISQRLKSQHLEAAQGGDATEENLAESSSLKIRAISDEIDVANQSINFLSKDVQQLEAEIVEKNRKLFDIENKLPSLNEQKKLAVSTRNFKEAGRVAAIIKDITAEKTEMEESIGETKEKLNAITTSIEEKSAKVQDLSKKLKELQDNINEITLKDLRAKRLVLHETTKEIKAVGSIDPKSFGGIVLGILQTEIDACEEQCKQISIKICGSEELANFDDLYAEETEPKSTEEIEKPTTEDDTEPLSSEQQQIEQQQVQEENVEVEQEHQQEVVAEEEEQEEVANDEQGDVQADEVAKNEQEQEEQIDAAQVQAEIEELEERIGKAIEDEDFDLAASLDEKLNDLRALLERVDSQPSEPLISQPSIEEDDANDQDEEEDQLSDNLGDDENNQDLEIDEEEDAQISPDDL